MKNEILDYIKSEVEKGKHPAQAVVARHFNLTRQNVNSILKELKAKGLIDWKVLQVKFEKVIFYIFPKNNT